MTRGLTEKQDQIVNFIVEYVHEYGFPPTIREIGDKFHISSLRGVTVHLDALQRKGYINRDRNSRSITVIGRTGKDAPERKVTFLPLVGTIAAGRPITAVENVEGHIPISQELVRNIPNAFVLRVQGDSMIEDHIMPNDLVIIKPQETAEHGDMVAVLLSDEATIKRIHFTPNGVRLMPANPHFKPIDVRQEDSRIIGKVIGLIRDYQTKLL